MGFRTTMVSEDYNLPIPDWFIEKHPYVTHKGGNLAISILDERKFYYSFKETELFIDIQKLMVEQNFTRELVLVLLHECGGITRVEISQTSIKGSEPTAWKEVESVEHSYCYGCSDIKNIITN